MKRVGILIFDDVEVLDFAGPFEVFATATCSGDLGREDDRLFHVFTVAVSPRTVRARGGLLIAPLHSLDDHPPIDVLVIPGGFGTRREIGNPRLLDWIREQARAAELVTSVCTGALLLAEAGLLEGLRATTHWRSIGLLQERYPSLTILEDARVVDEGVIITSAGVSAGIDMALHVVARLFGPEVAATTACSMEYVSREPHPAR